jgi:Tfp pilus assembly ATPase PilU
VVGYYVWWGSVCVGGWHAVASEQCVVRLVLFSGGHQRSDSLVDLARVLLFVINLP